MEAPVQSPPRKIYKEGAFTFGTLLGGPLVAGYLFSENYKTFGDYDKAKKVLVWAAIGFAALLLFLFMIPENWNFPNMAIPIGYTVGIRSLVRYNYAPEIEKFLAAGGQAHTIARVILVSIIGLAVSLLFIFIQAFLFA